ncbi:MAG: hypothetical protein KGI59_03500 [Patescibacteria group bacterium]|nr:hypothetical protein [Patescibacteria group bacterium]
MPQIDFELLVGIINYMNSSFLSTLTAILNDQREIAELPSDKLIAFEHVGEAVQQQISTQFLLKIARLQTLCVRAHQDGEMPDYEDEKQIAKETGQNIQNVMAKSLGLMEDSTHRAIMLERLMVEVVREAFPSECEHFDVAYYAHISGQIMRRPNRHHRFLD